MARAKISVVVVNYNGGAYLQRCVSSLLAADIKLSIVVIDNNSSDDSLKLVESMDSGEHELKIVRNSANRGFSCAVNQGAAQSDCKYLFLLNPDCVVHPHTVRCLVQEFNYFPQAAVIGALVFNDNGTEQRGCRRQEPTLRRSAIKALRLNRHLAGVDLEHTPLPENPIEVQAVSGSAMLFERARFDRVGGMDENYFLHCEDLDICRRIRDAGYQIIFTPNVSLFHHKGSGSQKTPLKVEFHKHKGMIRYYRQYEGQNDNIFKQLLVWLLVWARFSLFAVLGYLLGRRNQADNQNLSYLPITGSSSEFLLLTGARSDVGEEILKQLAPDTNCLALSRRKSTNLPQTPGLFHLHPEYLEKVPTDDIDSIACWISVAPLWSMRSIIEHSRILLPQRLIALSSSSIIGKSGSIDLQERHTLQQLEQSENWLLQHAATHGLALTIFRPTMIYGGRYNKSINVIARLIRLFRFFPLLGDANGLRQPVHAEDIAITCLDVLVNAKTYGQTYILGGGETLTYRELVTRLFHQAGIHPRLISLPLPAIRFLLKLLSWLPGLKFLNPEMLHRMQQDLVYQDHRVGQDFNYQPRNFMAKHAS